MRRLGNEAGFTLVELLIAVALTGVLSLAMFDLFSNQEQAFSIQDQVGEMQQNVRVSMELISRDALMAGYKLPPAFSLVVYDNVPGGSLVDGGGATVGTNAKPGTDAVTFSYVYVDPSASPPTYSPPTYSIDTSASGWTMNAGNFNICVDSSKYITGGTVNPSFTYQVGDLAGVYGAGGFQFIQITSTAVLGGGCNAGYTQVNIGFSPAQSPIKLPGGINDICGGDCSNPQPTLAEIVTRTYYVDTNNRLMVSVPVAGGGYNPQPLAENIEDLQLHYFLTGGGESDAPVTVSDVREIRINVLGRTASQDPRLANMSEPAIEDGVAHGPDGYRRRLLTSRIKVRNLGL